MIKTRPPLLDFVSLLTRHHIPFIRSGENVARNNINVQCPFCRDHDPSMHMGISLVEPAWGCWRDSTHRGRRPHRLLKALLGWTWPQIEALCGGSVDRSGLAAIAEKLRKTSTTQSYHPLPCPKEFVHIKPFRHPLYYGNYLLERGFHEDELRSVIAEYDLFGPLSGTFKGRIVIPIYGVDGLLWNWTGRRIGTTGPRYRTCGGDEALPDTELLWLGRRDSGSVLIITEGPFDAMGVDWHGQELGVVGTCVFGSHLSPAQESLIRELAHGFERVVVCLDQANFSGSLKFAKTLSSVGARAVPCPDKDLGELSKKDMIEWLTYTFF